MTTIISGTTGVTFPVQAGGTSQVQSSSGKVLQVVQGSYSTNIQNSTTSFVDTGLSLNITPSSSTSKVLVLVTQMVQKTNGNAGNGVNVKLLRNAVDFGIFAYAQGFTGDASDWWGTASFSYLDSPASTSSITYKTQFSNNVAAAYASVQPANSTSTITLMEIAA